MALDRADRAHSRQPEGRPADPAECRCACGSLVARLVPRGVELKCRRCKRTLVVPLEVAPGARSLEPRS